MRGTNDHDVRNTGKQGQEKKEKKRIKVKLRRLNKELVLALTDVIHVSELVGCIFCFFRVKMTGSADATSVSEVLRHTKFSYCWYSEGVLQVLWWSCSRK
jgi:hypothetical protein